MGAVFMKKLLTLFFTLLAGVAQAQMFGPSGYWGSITGIGASMNVQGTGIPGLDGGTVPLNWMIWAAPSTRPSGQSVLRVDFQPSYTGGSAGTVKNAIWNNCVIGNAVADFVYCGLSWISNGSTSTGVAKYARAIKTSTGATWANVSEVNDTSTTANSVGAVIAHEFDLAASGTDTSNNRVVQDIIIGKPVGMGAATAPTVSYGIRFAAGDFAGTSGSSYGTYANAILFSNATYGTLIKTSVGSSITTGIDLTASALTTAFKTTGLTIDGTGNVTGTSATGMYAGQVVASSFGTTGYLRLTTSAGTNYIQSGLQNAGGSAAPLVIGSINGGATWATISSSGVQPVSMAIASLPACGASNQGAMLIINNGTAYGVGTYGSAVSATGIVTRKVLCTNTAGATTYAWAYN